MPTYVYECKSCEKTIEVDQRITDDPLKDCTCGKKGTLKRVIQPTAVMFKGSGFYVNDSSPSKPEKAEPAEKSDKTETSDKADKTEKTAKPDPKPPIQ